MNGNVFKFDSKITAQRTNDKRTADYFVGFVHKTKWFDNNNNQVYIVYIKKLYWNRIIIGFLMITKIIK